MKLIMSKFSPLISLIGLFVNGFCAPAASITDLRGRWVLLSKLWIANTRGECGSELINGPVTFS